MHPSTHWHNRSGPHLVDVHVRLADGALLAATSEKPPAQAQSQATKSSIRGLARALASHTTAPVDTLAVESVEARQRSQLVAVAVFA